MLWKTVKYVLFAFVVVAAIFSTYSWLDTAVSLDFPRREQTYERERIDLLRQFVFVSNRGVKRSDVAQLIKQNFATEHIVKEEQDAILVDDVVLRFDSSQSLSQVQFLDEVNR